MQVERPGYGGKTPNLLPDVSAGPMVSADDMGAASWRQVRQLSGAVGNLGMSVLDEYQKQKQREDKAFFDSRMADAQMRLLEESKAIYEKHGEDALSAEKDMADLLARIKTDTAANLGTYEQRNMFNRSWQYFEGEAKQKALLHRQREMLRFEDDARKAKLLSMTETAKAQAAEDGGLGLVLRNNMAGHIEDEIRAANRGRPTEYVDHLVKAAVKSHHQELLKQFAARSPVVALEYLDSERVKGAFDLAECKALREQYQTAIDSSADTAWAFEMAKSKMSSAAIMDAAYEKYPDDSKKAEYVINLATRRRAKEQDDKNLAAVQEVDEMWQAAADKDYDLNAMDPDRVRSMMANHPDVAQRVAAFREWIDKAGGGGKIDPHYKWIDDMLARPSSEVRAWLNEPLDPQDPNGLTNYEVMMRQCGGNAEEINRIRAHARKTDGRGGEGGSQESAKFDVNKWFEVEYGAMYQTGWIWKESATYDPKLAEARNRQNGFYVRYQERLNAKEKELGRKANFDEQTEIAMHVARDVRAGNLNLESNFYDPQKEAQAAESNTAKVAPEQLAPHEAAINRGEPVIAFFNPDTGQTTNFGNLDVASTDENVGVFADVAAAKPRQALVAYDKGTIGEGAQARSYEPGWRIVTMQSGAIKVYNQRWGYEGEVAPAARADTLPALPAQEEPERPEEMPAMSQKLYDRYMSVRGQYPDRLDEVTLQWIGGEWQLRAPGRLIVFNRNGDEI